MPPVNRIAAFAEEMAGWRQHLHTIPELGRECHKTAAFVAERLREMGVDALHEGIAETGIVAIIEGRGPGPTIGLRADMDGLPIEEATGLDYASTHAGRMHACGHDGHTAMLLGAAKYLAETRNFAGRVALIFQPDEEATGGGQAMVEEGIMEAYQIKEVFGMHNAPGFPEGLIGTRGGPIMAAADTIQVTVKGRGGHGAQPHEAADPVIAACAIVQGFQTIVSRNVDAGQQLVISVTQIHTGSAENVIPATAEIGGTVRTFDPDVRDMAERRLGEIARGVAAGYGVEADVRYMRGYPATVNHADHAADAADVARQIVGAEAVVDNVDPVMGAEDFAYMLEARPGAYMFLGQGEGPMLHTPQYNFNDAVAPIGASFFARLVETRQPVG
ncbi:MAG: M20 aminoacylase family protein [Pseudomonadota bacterium]